MLPARAERYILRAPGWDPETIVERWNRGYPNQKITVQQVEETLGAAGNEPKLSVLSKPKAKAKAKKKSKR